MRTTDRVHSHRLQFRKFTMQGILVEGSSKTSEVMMLTDTIELEVLAIKPEARLCIKLESLP